MPAVPSSELSSPAGVRDFDIDLRSPDYVAAEVEMHQFEMHEPSAAFRECWLAAGRHLEASGQEAVAWIKAELRPPFLEHLSFRLGNQLFFIRVEDDAGGVRGPGNIKGLQRIASRCAGHACVMPMTRESGRWRPVHPGWGLLDFESRRPIAPPALVTDVKTAITDWELQDFAVQVVRQYISDQGMTVVSWNGNPDVDPSLWMEHEGEMEWVVVRAVRYPARRAEIPEQIADIAAQCSALSNRGSFASVAVANAEDPGAPLWRGHGYQVAFTGLETVDARH